MKSMPDQSEHPSEREKLLLAYLDGELPDAQRKNLEATLTESDRAFLLEEENLMRLAASSLNSDEVPEKLWTRLSNEVASGQAATPAYPLRVRKWRWGVLGSVAAMLLLAGGAYWFYLDRRPSAAEAFMNQGAQYTVQDLQDQVSVPPEAVKLSAHLAELDLATKVDGLMMLKGETMMGGHVTRFMGATDIKIADIACVVLLFDCCHQPIQVVLAPGGSKASRAFEDLMHTQVAKTQHLTVRTLGKVNAIFVGQHDALGILNLLGSAEQQQALEKKAGGLALSATAAIASAEDRDQESIQFWITEELA